VIPAATKTASIDIRPALGQYTSRRCSRSANSSRTSAVPAPNSAADPARQPSDCAGAAIPATPAMTMKTTPNTM
jgi:hypothetical protein